VDNTRTPCATPISGVVSFAFHTAALIQTDLLRSTQLIFHPLPRNTILLCISHRTIFRSICTAHLPFWIRCNRRTFTQHSRSWWGSPCTSSSEVVEGDWRALPTSIAISISFIILATLIHHLAFAISLHRSISTFSPSPHD